jgi:hypothetical protein
MSKKDRAYATEILLKGLSLIDTSGTNTKLTAEMLNGLSNQQFYNLVEAYRNKLDFPAIVAPNLDKNVKISVENNLKVAKYFSVDFFQQVWITDRMSGVQYLSPQKYLIIHLPVRRQIQTREAKMSVAINRRIVDDLTNQVTGPSAPSSQSQPETLVKIAKGNIRSAEEQLKVRGGDLKALNYADQQMYATGGFSLDVIAGLDSRAKAADTLSTFLLGMHYDNTF